MTVLKLMQRVGIQYCKSGRSEHYLIDLLELDTPLLFQPSKQTASEPDSNPVTHHFTVYLTSYARENTLRRCLLNNFGRILVSCKWFHCLDRVCVSCFHLQECTSFDKQQSFQGLIISVILEVCQDYIIYSDSSAVQKKWLNFKIFYKHGQTTLQ